MVLKLLTGALLSAMALTAAPAQAAAAAAAKAPLPSPPLELARVRGGPVGAEPIVDGNRLYVPTGRVLSTWDYSNPDAPVRVSTSLAAEGVINSLVRVGDHLYASWRGYDGSGGVASFSLLDPTRPKLVANTDYDAPAGLDKFTVGLAAANGHLYVFDNNFGIYVGTLGNPDKPAFSRTSITASDQYRRFVTIGNTIQANGRGFNGNAVLTTYDMSSPLAPVLVGSGSFDGFDNFSMISEAGVAFGIGNTLGIFDTSNPAAITRRSYMDILPATRGAHVGNFIYTYGYGDGLDIWNVANLDAPAAAGHLDILALGGNTTARVGNTLVLQTDTDLMQAIDVSTPGTPALRSTGWLAGGVSPRDFGIHAGRIVLLQSNYGLTTLDPKTLKTTSRFEAELPQALPERSFEQMAIVGDTAWTAAWGYGLIGVDLANPAGPTEVGRVPFLFAAVLDVKGRYAYAARWTNEPAFVVADLQNPAAPVLLTQQGLIAQPYRLRVDRQHAYIAEGIGEDGEQGGLRIFSLADPTSPAEVARINDGCGAAFDVVIDSAQDRAYLACGNGMQIIDIANPTAPVVIGRWAAASQDSYVSVAKRGNRAWYANGTDGLTELDITDPAHPVALRTTQVGHGSVGRLGLGTDGSLFLLGAAGLQQFRTPIQHVVKPRPALSTTPIAGPKVSARSAVVASPAKLPVAGKAVRLP